MKLKFYGAAEIVTGSNYLLETEDYKILIDCGLFQGSKALESLNERPFPYDPKEIDFLILTHAHIDHSGRIPKLVKEGFKGRIISTSPSYDLANIMLRDSAKIQESDAEWENKKRLRSGQPPIVPLYTMEDAENSLKYFEPYFYDQKVNLAKGLEVRFKDAGHILGSAIVELWIGEERIKFVFTGDLGMPSRPLLKDPSIIEEADYLIMESTYGDKNHKSYDGCSSELIDIINKTSERGGSVIIPSFAVGRTQELIYMLNSYYEREDLEEYLKIPIYIDSPLAVEATEVFKRNSSSFNELVRDRILKGDNPFEFSNLRYVKSQEESVSLNKAQYPKVIISSSGMATAGRVRHHLKHSLWDEKNSLVFVGYQAEGSLGRMLLDGKKRVKLLGEEIDVNLEIYDLEGFSGHADRDQLLAFVRGFKKPPKKIFLTHGEKEVANSLAKDIEEIFNYKTYVAKLGDSVELETNGYRLDHDESINFDYKEDILVSLRETERQFNAFIDRKETILESKDLEKNYDIIKNELIELQHKLMDLNMTIGK